MATVSSITSLEQPPTQPTVIGNWLLALSRSLRTRLDFSWAFKVAASPFVPAMTTKTLLAGAHLLRGHGNLTSGNASFDQEVKVLELNAPIDLLPIIVAKPSQRRDMNARRIGSCSFRCGCWLRDHVYGNF